LKSSGAEMKIVILGIGNLLLKDEGVGVHLVRALQKEGLPQGVEVIDGGTSPEAVYLAAGCDKLIIVDAARGGGLPGKVYRLTLEDLKPDGRGGPLLSGHELDLFPCLLALEPEERPKEVVILGIEPKEIRWGLGLSPELEAELERLRREVLRECDSESRS